MVSYRVAAVLIGVVTALFILPRCWYLIGIIVPLMLYGLLPRRDVRVGLKVVRIIGRVVGCLMLVLSSLFIVFLMMDGAPIQVTLIFLTFFFIPSLSLTLYGFELGIIPQPNPVISARFRALIVALATLALGLSILIGYTCIILEDIKFLFSWHRFGEVNLPGWVIVCFGLAISLFLLIIGIISVARYRWIAENIPRIEQNRGQLKIGQRVSQILMLFFGVLLIGVGPFIYMESGVFLAGFTVLTLGVYLTLLAVDSPALQATYNEVKAFIKNRNRIS